MEKFAKRLKELREELNLSQKALARETGISATAIRQWESQISKPIADAIIILAKYFKVSTDYLLGLVD